MGNGVKLFEFNKLVTEKYRIDKVLAFGQYYLMVGDFGLMEVSKSSIDENKEVEVTQITDNASQRENFIFEDQK